MKKTARIIATAIVLSLGVTGLTACTSDADVASDNLSKEADNFKINRRIVMYNAITDKYILSVEGFCSLGNNDPAGQRSITCKVGEGQYKKHFFGLADNVTFFAEQLDSAGVSTQHYKVIFKPESIIPVPEVR